MVWHEFRGGECMTCGIDESDYYCGLILSGKRRYDAYDGSGMGGKGMICGDHVNTVPALLRIIMAGEIKGLNSNDRADCADKLVAIAKKGGADAREANLALRELILSDKLGWHTLAVAKGINDPEIASDPEVAKAIERWEEADRRYENAMIAMDSGIGRTG